MSIWGRLAGAAAGLAEGGMQGLLGAFAGGHTFSHDSRVKHQVAFTIGVIALGAKMAKADGMVTRDEVVAFTEVFKVPEGEMENVSRVFNLAKQDVRLRGLCRSACVAIEGQPQTSGGRA